jgi:hypothetical protein
MLTKMTRSLCGVVAVLALSVAGRGEMPDVPPTPAPIDEIVSITPFTLEESYTFHWRAERPEVRTGYVLVLKVNPDLVYPRQTPEPVLFVGKQTAERVNVGHESGHVVAIVPAVLDDPGSPDYLDLETALIWFGTPQLPEQVDAATVEREHARAAKAGIRAMPQAQIEAARDRDGESVEVASKTQLHRRAIELVRTYSPQEQDLIRGVLGAEAAKGTEKKTKP